MSVRPPGGFGPRLVPKGHPSRKLDASTQRTPVGEFQESARRLARLLRHEIPTGQALPPVTGAGALMVQVDLRAALNDIDALPAGAPVVQNAPPSPQLSRIAGLLLRASEEIETGHAEVAPHLADQLRHTVNAAYQAGLFPTRQS